MWGELSIQQVQTDTGNQSPTSIRLPFLSERKSASGRQARLSSNDPGLRNYLVRL